MPVRFVLARASRPAHDVSGVAGSASEPDDRVPPGRPAGDGVGRGGELIERQRVTDDDDIVAFGAQFSPSFVGDLDLVERAPAVQPEGLGRRGHGQALEPIRAA